MMTRFLIAVLTSIAFSVPHAGALVLVDSAKQVIGEVVEPEFSEPGWVWVAMQHGTATALVLFGRQLVTAFDVLEFTGHNCTGESGIRVTSSAIAEDVLWQAAIAPPGKSLYFTKKSPKFPPRELVVNSGWFANTSECVAYDEPATGLFSHVNVVKSLDIYKPPFVIKTPAMK